MFRKTCRGERGGRNKKDLSNQYVLEPHDGQEKNPAHVAAETFPVLRHEPRPGGRKGGGEEISSDRLEGKKSFRLCAKEKRGEERKSSGMLMETPPKKKKASFLWIASAERLNLFLSSLTFTEEEKGNRVDDPLPYPPDISGEKRKCRSPSTFCTLVTSYLKEKDRDLPLDSKGDCGKRGRRGQDVSPWRPRGEKVGLNPVLRRKRGRAKTGHWRDPEEKERVPGLGAVLAVLQGNGRGRERVATNTKKRDNETFIGKEGGREPSCLRTQKRKKEEREEWRTMYSSSISIGVTGKGKRRRGRRILALCIAAGKRINGSGKDLSYFSRKKRASTIFRIMLPAGKEKGSPVTKEGGQPPRPDRRLIRFRSKEKKENVKARVVYQKNGGGREEKGHRAQLLRRYGEKEGKSEARCNYPFLSKKRGKGKGGKLPHWEQRSRRKRKRRRFFLKDKNRRNGNNHG